MRLNRPLLHTLLPSAALSLFLAGTSAAHGQGQAPAAPARAEQAEKTEKTPAEAPAAHPNILFILCDDLGYGDLSCFGQKHFATPNLDQLAADGTRLTQHYSGAPVCAPSRAALILGLHTGDCPVRDQQFDRPIPDTVTIASVLRQAGYKTLSIGKWGLGGFPAQGFPAHPEKRGFDAWYGLYTHAAGHVHYPDAEHPLFDGYRDVTGDVGNAYSTDLYTAKAKQWIKDQAQANPKQPFFMYLAYIAPHEAFNIPDGPYPTGAGLTGGVQFPLVTHPENKNKWIYPDFKTATYRLSDDPANPETPWTWQMQHYATMVRRIDQAVGDLRQTLKDLKIDKNTLIVFTSDNGPAYDDGLHATQFASWGPLDGFKRDLFEGGFREPTIVSWPGTVKSGVVSDKPSVQYDWLATFAQLGGVVPPATSDGNSLLPELTGKGKPMPHDYFYFEYAGATRRVEDIGTLKRHGYAPLPEGDPWGEQQEVRIGDYAGIRVQIKDGSTALRLYNVASDPHEDHDLAADPNYGLLLNKMNALLITSRIPEVRDPKGANPLDVFQRPYDSVPFPAVSPTEKTEPGLAWAAYRGVWPWAPDIRYLPVAGEGNSAGPDVMPALAGKPGAVEFKGYLSVPTTGVYTLFISGGEQAHVWLHGAHLLNSESDKAAPRRSERVLLAAGLHPIRILVTGDGRAEASAVRLSWIQPGETAATGAVIPNTAFVRAGR